MSCIPPKVALAEFSKAKNVSDLRSLVQAKAHYWFDEDSTLSVLARSLNAAKGGQNVKFGTVLMSDAGPYLLRATITAAGALKDWEVEGEIAAPRPRAAGAEGKGPVGESQNGASRAGRKKRRQRAKRQKEREQSRTVASEPGSPRLEPGQTEESNPGEDMEAHENEERGPPVASKSKFDAEVLYRLYADGHLSDEEYDGGLRLVEAASEVEARGASRPPLAEAEAKQPGATTSPPAAITALFPLAITPKAFQLTPSKAVIGYALTGGVGAYTADGNSIDDTAEEQLYCRVASAETGQIEYVYFTAAYRLMCAGHSGGIEDITRAEVRLWAAPGTAPPSHDEKRAAIAAVTELLSQDEDSLMYRARRRRASQGSED